jgi:hydrogenase/urease accessory protein HupE
MNIKIKRSILLLMIGFWMLPSNAVETLNTQYGYRFPTLKTTALERAKIHKIKSIGQASFKQGVVIPVFGISIENPMQDGLLSDFQSCTVKTCRFKMGIPAAQAQQLVVYQVSGVGMFLAPKTWKDVEAAMGPSGIASLMMSSADGREALTIYNTSACVGCSLSAASLYFPDKLLKQF